ncbi:MAG: NeuD/PglB/VioB family sugar acetyltransferase [Planctomycetaceae bacterium]|nr:NeuD/PglB/VioB family sugar acetyltransferase [Planctomycetaceae bacterium]
MADTFYARRGKRWLDLALTGMALVMLAGPMLVLAALVRWRLGSPILFRQTRPGLGGRLFAMVKFRTMTDARDADGRLLPDHVRLTRFGRLLRATSLDELPELWNVLRGEMSLVGPRPLLVEYLDRYTPEQARRHETLPGITGWAQVNGRNALGWEEKFALDVWYVDHLSLALDLRILLMTVLKVLVRDGVSAAGHATAPVFLGSTPQSAPGGLGAAQSPATVCFPAKSLPAPSQARRLQAGPARENLPVVVLGAGGHAKVVVSLLRSCGYEVGGLYDDRREVWGTRVLGVEVIGAIELLKSHRGPAVIAIGNGRVRQSLASQLPLDWLTAVHPTAWVDPEVTIGPGTVICAGAVIQPDVQIGAHNIVNTSATVDHDCVLGDFVHIAPGAHLTGNIRVGDGVLVGAGAVAIPGLTIGAWTTIGGGATVVRDLPSEVIAIGNPARILRPLGIPKAA